MHAGVATRPGSRTAIIALAVTAACGGRSAPPPLSGSSEPQTSTVTTCADRRSAGRTFAGYVSADPNDPRPVDDSFRTTWDRAVPTFAACRDVNASGEPTRVAVEFHVSRTGVITDASTHGPDAEVDRCVCTHVLSLVFPPQSRPVAAWFNVLVPPSTQGK